MGHSIGTPYIYPSRNDRSHLDTITHRFAFLEVVLLNRDNYGIQCYTLMEECFVMNHITNLCKNHLCVSATAVQGKFPDMFQCLNFQLRALLDMDRSNTSVMSWLSISLNKLLLIFNTSTASKPISKQY